MMITFQNIVHPPPPTHPPLCLILHLPQMCDSQPATFMGDLYTQVVMKRISPTAIPEPSSQTLDSGRSGKSGAQGSSVEGSVRSASTTSKAGAGAGDLTVTASGEADAWAPPMAAEALLIRGQLALLDGKLRVGGVESHGLHYGYLRKTGVYPLTLSELLKSREVFAYLRLGDAV